MQQNDVIIETPTATLAGTNGEITRIDRLSQSPLMQTLSLIARMVLGVVFLVAGAEKLGALDQFGHAIANYQIVPIPLVNIAALLFVWFEITAGILLIAGAAVRGSALVSSALLVAFLIAILTAMARGLKIDCGCFVSANGASGEQVGWPKVMEDVGLLILALFLIYFPHSYLTIDRLLRKERNV